MIIRMFKSLEPAMLENYVEHKAQGLSAQSAEQDASAFCDFPSGRMGDCIHQTKTK
jgi:hypothetical protein